MTGVRRQLRDAWAEGRWSSMWLYDWPDEPRWYRVVSRLSWHARHLVERPRAAWHIVRDAAGTRDVGNGPRAVLIVARGVACALTGRIDHHYPEYPGHPLAHELASWDHASWNGGEQTCWSAMCATVCTGRVWHLHVYLETGP